MLGEGLGLPDPRGHEELEAWAVALSRRHLQQKQLRRQKLQRCEISDPPPPPPLGLSCSSELQRFKGWGGVGWGSWSRF